MSLRKSLDKYFSDASRTLDSKDSRKSDSARVLFENIGEWDFVKVLEGNVHDICSFYKDSSIDKDLDDALANNPELSGNLLCYHKYSEAKSESHIEIWGFVYDRSVLLYLSSAYGEQFSSGDRYQHLKSFMISMARRVKVESKKVRIKEGFEPDDLYYCEICGASIDEEPEYHDKKTGGPVCQHCGRLYPSMVDSKKLDAEGGDKPKYEPAEGDHCTVDGKLGRLRMVNGSLVCDIGDKAKDGKALDEMYKGWRITSAPDGRFVGTRGNKYAIAFNLFELKSLVDLSESGSVFESKIEDDTTSSDIAATPQQGLGKKKKKDEEEEKKEE